MVSSSSETFCSVLRICPLASLTESSLVNLLLILLFLCRVSYSEDLLSVLLPRLMLFAIAQRVVDSGVDQRRRSHVVSEVLLGFGEATEGLGLSVVEIVAGGVVAEAALVLLHVVLVRVVLKHFN